jgi:hypothetical protein
MAAKFNNTVGANESASIADRLSEEEVIAQIK